MSKTRFVDLHCHSTASDGTFAPSAVVQLAKDSGLSALALTDHDTIAGIAEAQDAARSLGIDFLPGIELSCMYPRPARCTCSVTALIRPAPRSQISPAF